MMYNCQIVTIISQVFLAEFKQFLNTLSANPSKWSNTLKQFAGKLLTNCLSVFDHVVKFSLRETCPYLELFWSVFSLNRTEYGDSVQMRENTY